MDASKRLQPNLGDGNEDVEDRNIPRGLSNGTTETKEAKKARWTRRCKLESAQACFIFCLWHSSGIVGGLLSLGGGFIMGPLFLEIGILPQYLFSSHSLLISSIPQTLYFAAATILFAVMGQNFGGKVIKSLRKNILDHLHSGFHNTWEYSFLRVGIANMVKQIEHKEYIGFERKCSKGS
ncbi:unnamed protein product [Prunus armeniaca]|uniref:Uncharacterized protein n=1 Tax=Prunus armeniaca TaxID=36596 RepID=A0A6J5U8P4_PRUAR|nr:unnamed protein product [Prunus armeniaca]